MLDSKDRVIMISGAGRGIGLGIARGLHDRGYSLSLGARDLDALSKATSGFEADRVMAHVYDAEDAQTNAAWVEATAARFGRIDGLINNAGVLGPARIEDDDEEAFDRLWRINVMAPLRMIRLCLPHLRRCGQGRIVTIASMSGKRVKNDNAGYAMSKFAVVALSHAARRIGWEDGVRVTALCPGFVASDMTAQVSSVAAEAMTQPEDIADLVATVIALPNSASVAELLVNCILEDVV